MGDFAIFRNAATAVLHGRSPYPAPDPAVLARSASFVYPPLDAYALAPIAVLSRPVSDVAFLLLSIGGAALALRLLGVLDWRCYGLALLAPSVFFAFSVGALSPLLLLGTAAAWRFRDRIGWVALIVGVTVVAKLFLWPLLVWLAVTRRFGAAIAAVAVALVSALVSWAGIGFAGFSQYPDLLRVLDRVELPQSYSLDGLAWDLGLPNAYGAAALAIVALAGCGAMAYVARKPNGDSLAFMLAILTSLMATPLLWLHYLILLLAPIALVHRRLSWIWAVPLILWITPFKATPGDVWQPVFLVAFTVALGVMLITIRKREHAQPDRSWRQDARRILTPTGS